MGEGIKEISIRLKVIPGKLVSTNLKDFSF